MRKYNTLSRVWNESTACVNFSLEVLCLYCAIYSNGLNSSYTFFSLTLSKFPTKFITVPSLDEGLQLREVGKVVQSHRVQKKFQDLDPTHPIPSPYCPRTLCFCSCVDHFPFLFIQRVPCSSPNMELGTLCHFLAIFVQICVIICENGR